MFVISSNLRVVSLACLYLGRITETSLLSLAQDYPYPRRITRTGAVYSIPPPYDTRTGLPQPGWYYQYPPLLYLSRITWISVGLPVERRRNLGSCPWNLRWLPSPYYSYRRRIPLGLHSSLSSYSENLRSITFEFLLKLCWKIRSTPSFTSTSTVLPLADYLSFKRMNKTVWVVLPRFAQYCIRHTSSVGLIPARFRMYLVRTITTGPELNSGYWEYFGGIRHTFVFFLQRRRLTLGVFVAKNFILLETSDISFVFGKWVCHLVFGSGKFPTSKNQKPKADNALD